MPAAIETDSLTKSYGDTTALAGLDVSIPRGEVYGFLGPNGAGKTTTMRILTTLTTPSGGDAWVMGEHVTDRDAVVEHVGYLPETPPVYDELTAREQLTYLADLRDLDAAQRDRIDPLLERFGLADAANDPIRTYSKGMRQKAALAGTVLQDPDVIFLDEPTSGLDPRAARTVRDLVADLADEGRTVFLSTHILPVVEELADTVGMLANGRLVAEGAPADLKRRAEASAEAGLTGSDSASDPTERTLEDVFLSVTEDHAWHGKSAESEG
ncbi:ABC transporter ATP-binding protein [Halorientalis brevis]|uniref:ABC transporter ATP-binding protein n=1 Tax=Halorientalis brevis TaxID=1126241 RepID=A0ABD6CGC5_9EURY|nr:ABC transporter ATP-binding protein [Halorientalis brevis]